MRVSRYPRALPGLLIIAVLGTPLSASDPVEDPSVSVLKTEPGILVVWSEGDTHFTMEFDGDRYQLMKFPSVPLVFQLGDHLTQVITLSPSRVDPGSDGSTLLLSHRRWEQENIEEELGRDMRLTDLTAEAGLPPGTRLWQLDPPEPLGPEDNATASYVYLSAVVDDRILSVSSVVLREQAVSDAIDYLVSAAWTLRPSERPLDVDAIRHEIAEHTEGPE